jgi:TonB C terminal
VGALASLFLHALVLGPFILGTAASNVREPDMQGIGASSIKSDAEPVMTLIFINEPQVAQPSTPPPEKVASSGRDIADLVSVASLESLPAAPLMKIDARDDPNLPTPEPTDDQSERALLFGRYMNQITARIERAWERPRTPIGDELFRCQVRIRQDGEGNVREVMIEQCNGDTRWQQSLVQAIQMASPLPAPPTPAVFTEGLSLVFHAEPFRVGGSEQGYEPKAVQVAEANPTVMNLTYPNLRVLPRAGATELRITGRRVERVEPSGRMPNARNTFFMEANPQAIAPPPAKDLPQN